jgi:uncharacterized Zn finger protein
MPPATIERTAPIECAIELAPLTPEAVAAETDSGSFSRGRSYARNRHIFQAVRRQTTLRARCHGSSGGPYLVEATLATMGQKTKRNPVTFSCDCPRGGFCKHVVAVLLTWIDKPDAFEARPPIAEVLAGKNREELVALVVRMLGEDPELEDLLALPIPANGAVSDDAIDESAIRRQIAAALQDDQNGYGRRGRYSYGYDRNWDYDDYPAVRIAGKLERVIALAEESAEAGHWRNAMLLAATLVEEVAPRFHSFYDEDGGLSTIVVRADETLAMCLDAQRELPAKERLTDEERARLIDALFTIWQTSIDGGGLDLGEEGPDAIARGATPEEQRHIGERLRQSMQPVGDDAHQWQRAFHNRAAIGFLSLLSGEAGLCGEALLAEYRNAELWDDAVKVLVELGRIDEAVHLASRKLTMANALLAFADRLVASGDAERVERVMALVDDRLWEREGQNVRDDQALREWLERRYGEQGRPDKALELARNRFKAAPAKATYDAVRTAARLPGQPEDIWPVLRPDLLKTLHKHNDWYGLIDIHLEEGEIAEALAALEKAVKPSRTYQPSLSYPWGVSIEGHAARVAAAAEAAFPDEAVRIYRRLAEQRIARRERVNYQAAASYLVRVMRLLEARGRGEQWPPLIAEIREQNRSLRALREELDSLGLT